MEQDIQKTKKFHDVLREKADSYAFITYRVTKEFPREEIYGLASQLRRSALSVVLNYIEGYARAGDAQYKNFLRIAYGSLKESEYLIEFAFREKYLNKNEYDNLINLAKELGAMLWTTIRGINEKCK